MGPIKSYGVGFGHRGGGRGVNAFGMLVSRVQVDLDLAVVLDSVCPTESNRIKQ